MTAGREKSIPTPVAPRWIATRMLSESTTVSPSRLITVRFTSAFCEMPPPAMIASVSSMSGASTRNPGRPTGPDRFACTSVSTRTSTFRR